MTHTLAQRPETVFARGPDGHHLAYQVTGEGDRDILFVVAESTPIDLVWDDPLASHALGRLARIGRLILCDLRGWGASDSVVTRELPAMQAWADDIRVVLDAVGSERAAIVAGAEPCLPVMLFAATNPARVASLALINPYARYLRGPLTPWGMSERVADRYAEGYRELTGREELADRLAPSRAADPAFRRWFARAERLGSGPGDAWAVFRLFQRTDLTGILPSIRAPVLALSRRGDRHVRREHAALIAEQVADGRLVELDGEDNLWFSGDIDPLFDAIEGFLTGVGRSRSSDRVLATVLFTDIVDSTGVASRLGDSTWRGLREAHDNLTRAHVAAFRGRLIKSTGDGALATFDGPARAIECALALVEAIGASGLRLRAGLHTGEVEQLDDDVAGLAVHIGARVCGRAAGGEVLVSESVPPLVVGSRLRFEQRGTHALKGVPGEWRLYATTAA